MTTIELYTDRKGEQRWRMVASNGKILCDCAEGYKRRSGVVQALKGIASDLRTNHIQVRAFAKRANPKALQAYKDRVRVAVTRVEF